jgi:GTPase
MTKPIVAIIGRQNVGKSTLLNRIAGKQIAIVADLPGTTRDRLFSDFSWDGRQFTIVDTGGLEMKPYSAINKGVKAQAGAAIKEADVIIFLVDTKEGVVPLDMEIADELRRTNKPVVLTANKADNQRLETNSVEFHELGLGEPLAISAYHRHGVAELLDKVISLLPDEEIVPTEKEAIKVAIIGRPNVGKSMMLNALLGQERVIVDDTAGTTRDAIDTMLDFQGQSMLLIDTAGIRRRGKIERGVEHYSVIRALRSVERADIVLLVLDASESVVAQDTHIAGYVEQAGRGIVLVVNKWDTVADKDTNGYTREIRKHFKFMPYAPIMFTSAINGQGIDSILPLVSEIYRGRFKRFSTAEVNSVIQQALAAHAPPRAGRKQLKVFYVTQADINPPTFVFFVNDASLMHFSYRRYLENKLRESFNIIATPFRLVFKTRGEK